ncbi:MAG TPA: NYN domain-containing protein [Pyrinomonadaceae bacterium]|nr:NYN domain-containing protein [Pyrinomonadaceae bacterium]
MAVFIDGNNLFHAARFHNIDIDYNKLLRVLLGDGRLLRAFFYTGVDVGAERQQGFLLWMRRNGFRVIHKELKTFYDGTRKANLDVEIAVDMLSLAGRYDTAVLVSGDEDFVYAVNAVAYKGCRVEVAGFRSNTAPKLIDVADYFIDLGEIADKVRKEPNHSHRYYDNTPPQEPHHAQNNFAQQQQTGGHGPAARRPAPGPEDLMREGDDAGGADSPEEARRRQEDFDEHTAHVLSDPVIADEADQFASRSDFVRITDDQ